VGRHLTKALLHRGDEVLVVDPLVDGGGGKLPDGWLNFCPNDFSSFTFVREDCRLWFSKHKSEYFDEVFHLAAMVGGRRMIEERPLLVATDLAIDSDMWNWAVTAKPGRVVAFSSSAAYPIGLQGPVGYRLLRESDIDFEKNLGQPDLTYGWAKLTCEYLGRLAHQRYGLNVVAFRPFSGYGHDQDSEYPFPSICRRVLEQKGSKDLFVWGSGRQMRDFIHIDDCISGILKIYQKINDGSAVNLSTGIYTSFIEFASMAAELCGYYPLVSGLSENPEGVFARGGDRQMQEMFGFTPEISFRAGVEEALNRMGC
jgi:nucleoside-diphosphate-sugar epimerase